MSFHYNSKLYPNGDWSVALKKQATPITASNWVKERCRKISTLSEVIANDLRDSWYGRPEQWRKVQQGDHAVASFDHSREEFTKYPWLHQYDNLNTEPTAQPGLGLGGDLSQRLLELDAEAKLNDNPRASIFKGKNHKPYGCDGLNARARRAIESMGIILQKKFGKQNIGFVTLTLPWFGDELMAHLSRDFAEITKRYFEKLKRYFKSIGEELYFVRVTEIQPKRWKKKGQYALHLHYAFKSRSSNMWGPKLDKKGRQYVGKLYYLDIEKSDRFWREVVWNSVFRYEEKNGKINYPKIPKDWGNNMQSVRKGVGHYLSKYMSKGGEFLEEVKEWIEDKKQLGLNYELPKRWYGSSKNLVKLLKKHIVPIPEKLRNKLLALPEGRNPAPGVIYKSCPTFYSEKLQKEVILAHCGRISYKWADQYCFKEQENQPTIEEIFTGKNPMKYAKAMRFGGELISAKECDYTDYKKKGLLCPNCSNPVFLVKGKKGTSKLGKEFVVEPYFAHYNLPKEQAEVCELRIKNYSQADINRARNKAKGQREKFFRKWFWSVIRSAKFSIHDEPLGVKIDYCYEFKEEAAPVKAYFDSIYPQIRETILGNLDLHLALFIEAYYEALERAEEDTEESKILNQVLLKLLRTNFDIAMHIKVCREAFLFLFTKRNRDLATTLMVANCGDLAPEVKKRVRDETIEAEELIALLMNQLIKVICLIPWEHYFAKLDK